MTRHVQIRLEDEEYDRFCEWAKSAGYSSLQRAGKAAALKAVGSEPHATEALTERERRAVERFLKFYRSNEKRSERRDLVLGLIEEFTGRSE